MNEESIGIIAARNAGARAAFETFGVDYYCAGDRSLTDAARAAGVAETVLRLRLARAIENDPATEWQDRSMRDMVTHLEHEHHQILRVIIFHSAMLLNEAASVDGAEPTAAMRRAFRELSDELIMHIEKEEHLFFPTLLSLETACERAEPSPAHPGEVRKNVTAYVMEHSAISSKLSRLRAESAPLEPIGSPIVRALLNNLTALERHVHEYLNLENYLVFPRAIALEDDLQRSPQALAAARANDKRRMS